MAPSPKDTAESSTGSLGRVLLPLLLLLLPVLLVYSGVGDFGFVRWDDNLNVYQNPHYPPKSLGELSVFWKGPYEQLYIPVTYTVWGVVSQYALLPVPRSTPALDATSLAAGPFHWLNLLCHLLNISLLFALLRKLRISTGGAVLGTAVFALHPIQVEAVCWITSLKDLLSTGLGLSALWCLLAARKESANARLWSAAALVIFVLALLSKPSVATLPLVAIFLLRAGEEKPDRKAYFGPAVWAVFAAAIVFFTNVSQPLDTSIVRPSLPARFGIAGDALLFYLGKIIWPFNFGVDYGHTPAAVLARPGFVLLGLVPLAITLALVPLWRRAPRGAAALALFFLAALPTLGFVSFGYQMYSTVADRYIYTSMAGVALAIGLGWDWIARRSQIGALATAACGAAVCLFLAYQSTLQTVVWHDSMALFEKAIQVNPDSWAQHNNLALVLLDADQPDAALEQTSTSLRLNPANPQAWLNQGSILLRQQHYRRAKECFEKLIELRPDIADGYYNLAIIYYGLGEKARATELLNQALQRQPGMPLAVELMDKVRALPDKSAAKPAKHP